MMVKFCIGVFTLVCAVSVPLLARDTMERYGPLYKSRVGLRGGYTTVTMNDVNDALSASAAGGSVTGIANGYDVAGDFLYRAANRFYLGARIEYVGTNQGKASTPGGDVKQDLYLVPLMAGGRYFFNDICCTWNYSVGVFAGVGLGYGTTNAAGTITKYDGSAFAGEVLLGGEYQLGEPVSLGLDVGYRYAPLSSMSPSTGGGGGYAAAPIANASGGSLTFDFSGVFVNVGINYRY